jgi:hypothetical protein
MRPTNITTLTKRDRSNRVSTVRSDLDHGREAARCKSPPRVLKRRLRGHFGLAHEVVTPPNLAGYGLQDRFIYADG